LIIDKKERRLKKGSGFHLDIVIVCIANVGCGLLGAPWQCAATVRSIAHVSAVTVMSRTHAPGDKPHIIEVKGKVNKFLGLKMKIDLVVQTACQILVVWVTRLLFLAKADSFLFHYMFRQPLNLPILLFNRPWLLFSLE